MCAAVSLISKNHKSYLDGKACAAVGQNILMALFDTLFSQQHMLLVTDRDFKNNAILESNWMRQCNHLLALRVIPILNEKVAVSTRKAPNERIHTYIKEIHQSEITVWNKSRVGRGGMTATVKAAVNAAYAGIPVVNNKEFHARHYLKEVYAVCKTAAYFCSPSHWVGAPMG
ncbi:hypothetical protein NC652_020602 [Populus alba x Populus x berolinensis]|nr:hypothetical protein NC652_020602 [Populus alba x Populus x berolinensis]